MEDLQTLLQLDHLTEVVDIGANPIDGDPPYKPMLDLGLCRVTGFEPQPEALAKLQARESEHERYLPYAVGDGNRHTLNLCRSSGMTSLYRLDPATEALFPAYGVWGEVTAEVALDTRRLDTLDEIERMDFLKIDIQGGELAVFQNGKAKLAQSVMIQTEVSLVPLYLGQPVLGDIDLELRSQGFIPHAFAGMRRWVVAPCSLNNNPYAALNQVLETDMVYMRDIRYPERMSDDMLKHMAMIAYHCYNSFDLSMRCVQILQQRGSVPADTLDRFTRSIPSGRIPKP